MSFSSESLELARTMREHTQQQSGIDEAESEKAESPAEQFAAYMNNARSKAQSGGSVEEQIKKLEDKIQNLQNQLISLATDENSSSGKSAQAESIQSQINALMTQISELQSQAKEEAV